MLLILIGDLCRIFHSGFSDGYFSYEVPIFYNGAQPVDCPWHESSLFCVWGSEYDWQLGGVDPSSLPVYFGLCGHELGVTQDGFIFSKVC